ncbi:hypothetical protein KJ966_22905 [bacterium]|nr:hypothetical protein [bacterium]
MKRDLNVLIAVLVMLVVVAGCDAILGSDEEFNAGEIIKDNLKSPSSFKKLDGKVLWRGKNDFGESFVVRINYEAKNSFGVSIQDCHVVAYSNNGKQLHWNPVSSIWPCKTVGDNPNIIEGFAEGNGLGKGSLVGQSSSSTANPEVAVQQVSAKTSESSFESSFIKSWRESFVTSCNGQNAAEVRVKLCECVAEKSIQALTVDQLQDQEYALDYIKTTIVPQCQ